MQVKAQSPIVKLLSNDIDSSRDRLEQQQLSVQQASELKAGQRLALLSNVTPKRTRFIDSGSKQLYEH